MYFQRVKGVKRMVGREMVMRERAGGGVRTRGTGDEERREEIGSKNVRSQCKVDGYELIKRVSY